MSKLFDNKLWFEGPAFRRWRSEYPCPDPECGGVGVEFVSDTPEPDFVTLFCKTCGRAIRVLPGPKTPAQQKRRRPGILLPELSSDICRWCGKTREECEAIGRRLEQAHRSDRAALIDAGLPADELTNLEWLCAGDPDACHEDQQKRRRETLRQRTRRPR